MSSFEVFLWISLSLISVYSKSKEIEPWTTNSTGEYYLFEDRPDDDTIRNLTCKEDNCIIRCNEEESCQRFNIHGGETTKHIDLQCDYPKQKELRPGSCWRANIFTEKTENVDIYCTLENCAETKFYINNAHYANLIFDGDWAGKYATIHALEVKNDLYITCNDTESCSDLSVYCPLTNKCNLNCNGTKACWNSNIYLRTASMNDLILNCDYLDGNDTSSCTGLTIHCLNEGSNQLWYDHIDNLWRCFDKDSKCCPDSFKQKSNEIICENDANCIIDCDKDDHNCHWGVIDASKAKSLVLKCNKDDQCKITKVHCPENKNAECIIECYGKESCKFMNISSPLVSQLDISCEARGSCQNMRVDVTVNAYVNIGCNNEWSCGNSKFNIQSGKALTGKAEQPRVVSVVCKGRYSCEGIDLYCPYATENSCNLRCSDDDSSCNGVQIFAPERYEYDYLQIECPDKPKAKLKPCNFMRVKCKDDKNTVLRYIKDVGKCSKDDCCPWKSEIKNKNMNMLGQDKEYGTIVAILCVLVSMYLLTTGCNMFTKS